MAELTAEFKRRALYTVMSAVVTGDTLMEILWVWEQKYSSRSQYELNGFFSEIKEVPGVAKHRATLYRELIALLMRQSEDLLPDPWQDMQAYREKVGEVGSAVIVSTPADWSGVWLMLADSLISSLEGGQLGKLRLVVEERMHTEISDHEIKYNVVTQLSGKTLKKTKPMSFSIARKLLNFLYVGLCEVVGPSGADRMLATAVSRVESESPALNPRELLNFKL